MTSNRRTFVTSALGTAAALQLAGATDNSQAPASDNQVLAPLNAFSFPERAALNAQARREAAFALFSSVYVALDSMNIPAFLSHFVQSDQTIFDDYALAFGVTGYPAIADLFTRILNQTRQTPGPGAAFKLFYVSGDPNYGAIVEHVNLRNTFFGTNGNTTSTVFDLDSGLTARQTDYWDSREMGESDLFGPAQTEGVGFPAAPIHPGGSPRQSNQVVAPDDVALAVGPTGKPSVSSEMISFAQRFHQALASGNLLRILSFFSPTATYINPVLHQGPPLYGNYNQTIQITGIDLIAKFFLSVGNLLPDTHGSLLLHIVGGISGGGFEWKAGGQYAGTGVNRNGLDGCTAIDLVNGKIQRMSVRFDTYQLPSYDNIRSILAAQGIVDQ